MTEPRKYNIVVRQGFSSYEVAAQTPDAGSVLTIHAASEVNSSGCQVFEVARKTSASDGSIQTAKVLNTVHRSGPSLRVNSPTPLGVISGQSNTSWS